MNAQYTRPMSTHAKAAKMIRTELKRQFPGTTFRVRSRSYSGGDAVDVSWTDGPTVPEVERIVSDYQQCSFDGMIDLKEYTNRQDHLPQVDWVQCHREMSAEVRDAIVAILNRQRGWNLKVVDAGHGGYRYENDEYKPGGGWQSHDVWPLFYGTALVCGACHAATLPGDRYCPQCGTAMVAGKE